MGVGVELFAVEVEAVGTGSARLGIEAGSGVDGLAEDFIVAPLGGGEPITGGNYALAEMEIEVVEVADYLDARLSDVGGLVKVLFNPVPGFEHRVEYSEDLSGEGWRAISGGPHQSGEVEDVEGAGRGRRFYRVVAKGD